MKFDFKPKKYFWMFYVLGGLLITLAAFFAPIWNFWQDCPWQTLGYDFVTIGIAILIFVYLFVYLFNKVKTSKSTIRVLTIVEFTLMAVIAVGCILMAIPDINSAISITNDACLILGIALLSRGTVEVFHCYYKEKDPNKYPVWNAMIAVVLLFLGSWMVVAPFFDNYFILWVFVVITALAGILSIIYAIIVTPKKTKK